jgi:hypothetical protein
MPNTDNNAMPILADASVIRNMSDILTFVDHRGILHPTRCGSKHDRRRNHKRRVG